MNRNRADRNRDEEKKKRRRRRRNYSSRIVKRKETYRDEAKAKIIYFRRKGTNRDELINIG